MLFRSAMFSASAVLLIEGRAARMNNSPAWPAFDHTFGQKAFHGPIAQLFNDLQPPSRPDNDPHARFGTDGYATVRLRVTIIGPASPTRFGGILVSRRGKAACAAWYG